MVISPGMADQGTVAVVSHNGDSVSFSLRFVEKTSAGGRKSNAEEIAGDDFTPVIDRLFDELNQFIAIGLTPQEQQLLFNIYKEIHRLVAPQFRTELKLKLRELYSLLDLRRINQWVVNYSNITPSKTIKKNYTLGESPHPRDRTYIEADYLWLASLAVALRAMLPIWGEWFQYSEQSNNFKEKQAFLLLSQTSLMTGGPDPTAPATYDIYPPMQKLEMFVAGSIPAKDIKQSAIIEGGLSTEELPEWMLALTVVRRVSVGELRNDFTNQKKNVCLVASIYKFIDNRINQMDKNFGGRIIKKDVADNSNTRNEENNLSRLEGFREHDRISDNAIVENHEFTIRPYNCIKALSRYSSTTPNQFDVELYDEILGIVQHAFQTIEILPVQERMIKWMARLFMSPRMLDHMDNESYNHLMAASATMLATHGHSELAGIICGIPTDGGTSFSAGAPSSSNRMEPGLATALKSHYALARLRTIKRSGPDTRSAIEDNLNNTATEIKQYVWNIILPERVCNFTLDASRKYVPFETKTLLAKLAICIAERKF